MKIKHLMTALASAAVLASAPASADLLLRLQASAPLPFPGAVVGPTVTLQDNVGLDVNPVVGAVTFVGPLGNWLINVTTGAGSAAFGGQPVLDLSSVNISTFPLAAPLDFPSGAIELQLTETNLSIAAAAQLINFLGHIGGTTQGRVKWEMWVDDGNAQFGLSQLIGMGDTMQPAFAASFSGLRQIQDTFSMTLRVIIEHGDGVRTTSFDFMGATARIPEPGTLLLLLGGGVMLLAFARRPTRA